MTPSPRSLAITVAALLLAAPLLAGPRKAAAKAAPPPTTMAKVTDSAIPLDAQDDARIAAEAYLKAISGQGNDGAIDTLLGGATMTARIFTLENWKLVERKEHRHEQGELADVTALVDALDREGRGALAKMMGGGPGSEDSDGLATHEVSADEAKKILEPTRAKANAFKKTHPVFAYVARVDKEVYWHPKNPFRKLLTDAGAKGKYELDLDYFWVETAEGIRKEKTIRKWPLRVVRFKANGVDTGMKILPASDWNAE